MNMIPLLLIAGGAALMLGGKKKKKRRVVATDIPQPPPIVKTAGARDAGAGTKKWKERQKALKYLADQGVCSCDPGAIDGAFGPSTKRAVKAFQTYANIDADGLWGAKTETAMTGALAQMKEKAEAPTGGIDMPSGCDPHDVSTWPRGQVCLRGKLYDVASFSLDNLEIDWLDETYPSRRRYSIDEQTGLLVSVFPDNDGAWIAEALMAAHQFASEDELTWIRLSVRSGVEAGPRTAVVCIMDAVGDHQITLKPGAYFYDAIRSVICGFRPQRWYCGK